MQFSQSRFSRPSFGRQRVDASDVAPITSFRMEWSEKNGSDALTFSAQRENGTGSRYSTAVFYFDEDLNGAFTAVALLRALPKLAAEVQKIYASRLSDGLWPALPQDLQNVARKADKVEAKAEAPAAPVDEPTTVKVARKSQSMASKAAGDAPKTTAAKSDDPFADMPF